MSHRRADADLVISYLTLRKALGVVGLAMPIAVKLGAWWFEGIPSHESISAYYYTSMRDVFVGSLFAIGIFLFCYRGHDRQDTILSTVAGAAAAGIALLPTAPSYHSALIERFAEAGNPACYCARGPLGFHLYAVGLFFGTISYMLIFRFTRTDQVLVTPEKHSRNRIFVLCGVTMLAAFVYVALLKWLSPKASIFWPETVAIVAFSVGWLTKGQAILKDRLPSPQAD